MPESDTHLNRVLRCAAFALLVLPASATAAAQLAAGVVPSSEASCTPSWVPTFGAPQEVDDDVFALAALDDGGGPALFVGGTFSSAGGVNAGSVARWDGTSWSSLGSGFEFPSASGFTSYVRAFARWDDGGGEALYAAGAFALAGGSAASNVARWNGSSWSSVGSGFLGGSVKALATFDDGGGARLFAGGDFTGADFQAVRGLAQWDGASWSSVGGNVGGAIVAVGALAVFDDGTGPALRVTASRPQASILVGLLAKWDGTSWTDYGAVLDNGGILPGEFLPESLLVFDDGNGPALYAGGGFHFAGGLPVARLARWNGTHWTPLFGGMDESVHALALFDDGGGTALFAGGGFTTSAGGDAHLATWVSCAAPEPGAALCLGDGTGPACPCGNNGATGHGCDNSAATGGVRLFGEGVPASNTVVLHAEGFPPAGHPAGVVIRSIALAGPATPFGDGLLCSTGPVVRLAANIAADGYSSHLLNHSAGPGAFHYQLWYRNTPSFCTPSAFNLSNAYTIVWP